MRISLAAKYRVLFGCAVALILAAALSVPWRHTETLVMEQPFREARRIAEDFFRVSLATPHGEGAAPMQSPHVEVENDTSLGVRPRVQFIARPGRPQRWKPTDDVGLSSADPFVTRAFNKCADQPARKAFSEMRETEEGRRYLYGYAVRVARGCLRCHDEGASAPTTYRENELAGLIVVDLPAELSRQGVIWNRLLIIAAGALAGILAILVFYIITHRFILSPIEELRGVASRVAEGDLAVRSSVKTGDEFEQLADSLNTMLERLRDSQDELKRANALLDQKLGDLAETNVALYESNRLKSEFIANVSHELRTPLTSIIGFAELLREGPHIAESPKAARYAENILISGRILLEIINDLLDLARIEAGKVEVKIEEVDVRDLCATLIDFSRPQIEKKTLDVALDANGRLPSIFTDRGRLRQVLFNLLSNAMKFTPEGGQVRVGVTSADKGVRLTVTDSGPGIAPEHQEMIFEKFRQIDQSKTREHAGAGLGLAIAKELTELLGGTIGVTSEIGHGATFTVDLPQSAPEPTFRRGVVLS